VLNWASFLIIKGLNLGADFEQTMTALQPCCTSNYFRTFVSLICLLFVLFAPQSCDANQDASLTEDQERKLLSTCNEIGFDPQILRCGTCDRINEVLHNEHLLESCLSCCVKEKEEESNQYSSAVLYVDDWTLQRQYPMIYNFVNEKLHKYKGILKVKYDRRGKYDVDDSFEILLTNMSRISPLSQTKR